MSMRLSVEETLSGKKKLITSATGLIGPSLIKALIRLNDRYNLNLHTLALIRSDVKARSVFGVDFNSNAVKFIMGGGATP